MRLRDLWRLTQSIRALSKTHKEWGKVYRQYMLCLTLMCIISAIRYLTECALSLLLLYVFYLIISHPPAMNAFLSGSFHRWLMTYFQIPTSISKMVLT